MVKIFVSYSRADSQFVDQFVPIIRRVYGKSNVWYDDDIHGGANWWKLILSEIEKADLFIYLISNESLESSYCQAELEEASRLQKPILPVLIRRTDWKKAPDDLRQWLQEIQFVDFSKGVRDANAAPNLFAAMRTLLEDAHSTSPAPKTSQSVAEPLVSDKKPILNRQGKELPYDPDVKEKRNRLLARIGGGFVAILVVVFAFYMLVLQDTDENESATPTSEGNLQTEDATEVAVASPNTPTPSLTPSNTQPPTPTLSATDIEGTIQAEMVLIGIEAGQTLEAEATRTAIIATGVAQSTIYANETEIAHATETATLYTLTPTIDTRATAEARSTQAIIDTATVQAYETATQVAINDTATATLWTATLTATFTPSNTPILTPTLSSREKAEVGVISNSEWTPYSEVINGVEMVLVPKGCFMMGSEDGEEDESPAHEQCFDAPFWIDKTEATRAMYQMCVHDGVCTETRENEFSTRDTQPINSITWFQAVEYCEWRGTRLPTEREWEYAARGLDNWVYPWGNEFMAANVVYGDNSENLSAGVGSRPHAASWVGALDMSGNVWEWVSTIYYAPYPYSDNWESNDNSDSSRVLRGGSFYEDRNFLRAAERSGFGPSFVFSDIGFRCARDYEG